MSAEVLRKAAALMRERAEAATAGPWGFGGSGVSTFYVEWVSPDRWNYRDDVDHRVIAGTHDTSSRVMREDSARFLDELRQDTRNGEHIASWHPAVALAVAAMLETEAEMASTSGPGWATDEALTVARAYLGADR